MAINTCELTGKSEYVSPTDEAYRCKAEAPLYQAVRELVNRHLEPDDGLVLDIGCSDFVATGKLIELGYRVIGLDLDESAAKAAKVRYPDADVVVGDVEALPIQRSQPLPKVILLLDILEHLEQEHAIQALAKMRANMGKHTLIVSMPNVSPFSYYTLKEGIKWLTDQRRPATGLFDRTHQVLTDITGHKRMFEKAGYEIAELYSTSGDEGVSGEWKWKKSAQATQVKMEKMVELKYRAYKLIARRMLPRAVALLKSMPIDEAKHTTSGYQGLYVLKPKHHP